MPRKSKKQNLNRNANSNAAGNNGNGAPDSNANWNTPSSYNNNAVGNSNNTYANNKINNNANTTSSKKKPAKAATKAGPSTRKAKKQAAPRSRQVDSSEDDDYASTGSSVNYNYNAFNSSSTNYNGGNSYASENKSNKTKKRSGYSGDPSNASSAAAQDEDDDTSASSTYGHNAAPKQLAPEDMGIVVTDMESVKIEEVGAQIIDRVVAFELQRNRARYHSLQSIMEKVVRYNPLFYANFMHPYILQNPPAWKKFSAYISGRVAWPGGASDIRASLVDFKVLKKIADDIVLNRLTSRPPPRPRFDFKRV